MHTYTPKYVFVIFFLTSTYMLFTDREVCIKKNFAQGLECEIVMLTMCGPYREKLHRANCAPGFSGFRTEKKVTVTLYCSGDYPLHQTTAPPNHTLAYLGSPPNHTVFPNVMFPFFLLRWAMRDWWRWTCLQAPRRLLRWNYRIKEGENMKTGF